MVVTENTLRVWKILENHDEPITVQKIAIEAGIHLPKVVGAVNALVNKELVVRNEDKKVIFSEKAKEIKPVLKTPQKSSQSTQMFLEYIKNQTEVSLEELIETFDCLPELAMVNLTFLISKKEVIKENDKYYYYKNI